MALTQNKECDWEFAMVFEFVWSRVKLLVYDLINLQIRMLINKMIINIYMHIL